MILINLPGDSDAIIPINQRCDYNNPINLRRDFIDSNIDDDFFLKSW